MVKNLRIGIIGAGGNAGAHARQYKVLEGVEVVAVADIVPGKAQEFIQMHELPNAKAYENFRDMLQLDLDGVSVCTPNVAHHIASMEALQAGKHVLVEKPLSVTLEEGVEMVQAAKRADRMLSVGFQPRYDPNMQEIRKIVQSGRLGDIYYVQAGGGRRRGIPPRPSFVNKEIAGAGALADIGCYSLDLILHSLGHPKPLTVSAYTSNHFGTRPKYCSASAQFDVEDFATAFVRFEGGIVLDFKTSWAMHMDTLGPTLFLGKEAGLKVEPEAKPNPNFSGVWDGGVGSIELFEDTLGHPVKTSIPIKSHQLQIFQEKIKDFVRAIREDGKAPIPAEEILINQAIIDGMIRSSQSMREVEIDIPKI